MSDKERLGCEVLGEKLSEYILLGKANVSHMADQDVAFNIVIRDSNVVILDERLRDKVITFFIPEQTDEDCHQKIETVLVGDDYIDTETGVVIATIGGSHEFHVDTVEELDWVLEKTSDAEAELAGIEAQYNAVLERLNKQKRGLARRLEFFTKHFNDDIEALLEKKLPRDKDGKLKKKSLARPFGTVSLRSQQEGFKVTDDEEASHTLQNIYEGFLKDNDPLLPDIKNPDIIRTTKQIMKSKMSHALCDCMIGYLAIDSQYSGDMYPGFKYIPEKQTVSIKTGIKVPK